MESKAVLLLPVGKERFLRIMEIAGRLNWFSPNPKGYPFMQASEVEKCLIAMYDDFEFKRFLKWEREVDENGK